MERDLGITAEQLPSYFRAEREARAKEALALQSFGRNYQRINPILSTYGLSLVLTDRTLSTRKSTRDTQNASGFLRRFACARSNAHLSVSQQVSDEISLP
jgi:hypothetical protein